MSNERYVKLANELKDYDTIKDFCEEYYPYVYVFVKDYVTDPYLLETLIILGDEKLKRFLDVIFIKPKEQSNDRLSTFFNTFSRLYNSETITKVKLNNGLRIFDTFAIFDKDTISLVFGALQKRIEENSPLLNQEIYRVLLQAYHTYINMMQQMKETSKIFDDKLSELKLQPSDENPKR